MTPAILLAKKAKVAYQVHEYSHDANCQSYGLEAAEKLGIESTRVFKTIVVKLDSSALACAILPVDEMLSMKHIAKAASAKKAMMADKDEVMRSSGYVLGGVSPLGQKKRLKTFIDASASQFDTIYVSAGKRGLEIELSATDLANLTNAKLVDLIQR
ncbi:Cys-tRNA(Pro) deacylase [Alteromonadaceae bacterium BrNp21-10]|nr:Cys-tRNA(Pro) deacylase [Alteromonadaceae bacterium BrNp21-10]